MYLGYFSNSQLQRREGDIFCHVSLYECINNAEHLLSHTKGLVPLLSKSGAFTRTPDQKRKAGHVIIVLKMAHVCIIIFSHGWIESIHIQPALSKSANLEPLDKCQGRREGTPKTPKLQQHQQKVYVFIFFFSFFYFVLWYLTLAAFTHQSLFASLAIMISW